MLDLGFLEDVEKILSNTPNGRQTALFSATMPGPDPLARRAPSVRAGDDQGQGGDADHRHRRAVLPGDEGAGQGRRARARAGGRAADAGDRLRAHEDPHRAALPHAARQGHERQGAARRHEPGIARRRDDLLQERPAADPRRHRRRRPRARHRRRHPHRQLRRADVTGRVCAPDRPHRPRRALGPRDHVRRAAPAPRPGGDREARRHEDLAVGGGRARGAGAADRAAAPPPRQAERRQRRRQRRLHEADRVRRPRRRAGRGRPDPRGHVAGRHRRHGGAQRARARAVRAARGAGRRRRPRGRRRRRHRGPGPYAPGRSRHARNPVRLTPIRKLMGAP